MSGKIIKRLGKVHDDLLLTPKVGKYSRKSVTWLVGLLLIVIGVIRGLAVGMWMPDYIFYGLLAFVFGVSALSVMDKRAANNSSNGTVYHFEDKEA